MQDYAFTKHRIFQWIGILLALGVIAVGYWYYQSQASTLNKSPTGSLTSGLIGYWTFDASSTTSSTATDQGSGGNNGTLTNSPQATEGKNGQALNFFPNGSDGQSYVTMGDPVDGDLDFGSGDFTVSFWMKGRGYSSQGSSNNTAVAKKSFTSFTTAGYGFWYGSSNVLSFTIANGTTAYSAAQPVSTVADNQWHHYVGTRSGTSTTALYVDGVKVAENTTATGSVSNSIAFIAGTDSSVSPNDRNANAVIDEVRVYNAALTASQIQSLYNLGSSDKVNSSVSQPQGSGRLDSGLAGYWALDDGSGTSATDSSTNGNTGTLTSGPTWSTGQIGGAADLDGDNDFITMGDPSSGVLDFGSDNFSVGFWMNGAGYSNQIASNNTAVSKRNDSSSSAAGYSFTYPSTNIMSFTIGNGSTNFSASHTVATTGDNTWHHYVGTRIGSTIYLFVDGALVDSQSVSGSVSSTTDFQIGDSGTLGTRNSNALFDEVRVYNRTLSADEISQLYSLTSPTAVDTNLKGYWSFNAQDMSGTTAYDRSGAGNTGTLTSGPTVTEGIVGQALSFDGTDDYVNAGTASSLKPSLPLTVSYWVKPTTVSTTQGHVGNREGTIHSGFWTVGNSDGSLSLSFGNWTGCDSSGRRTKVSPVSTLVANQWQHIVGIIRGDTDMTIYVNGVDVGGTYSGTAAGGMAYDASSFLRLGAHGGGGGCTAQYLNGALDEVRVYNAALSAAQIKSQYDAGQSDKFNSSVSQPQGTGRLDSGLVGYWAMDDGSGTSATDSSTNANTGTLTNGPTWGSGQIGGAVTLDGTDDYVSVTQNGKFALSSRPFTVSVWARYTGTISGTAKRIVSWDDGSKNIQLALNQTGTTFFIFNASATSAYSQATATTVVADTWYHVTATFDGVSTYRMYLNGSVNESGSGGSVGSTGAGSTNLYIGQRGDASSTYFPGNIDEVRIYNRTLSSDEVRQLYQLSVPTGTDTSLKGYWSFNGQDVSGTTAYDRSGAGNTGTLTNGPAITEGKIGQGVSLDGGDDYISIPDADSIDYDYSQDFSFALWVKIPSTQVNTVSGDNFIVEKWSGSNGYPYTLRLYNQTYGTSGDRGKVVFRRYDGTNAPTVTSTSALNDNKWHHIAGTKSGSTLRLYIDGASQATTTDTTTTTTTNTSPLYLGTRGGGSTNFFQGSFDEFRLYSRTLSDTEVASLYNLSR